MCPFCPVDTFSPGGLSKSEQCFPCPRRGSFSAVRNGRVTSREEEGVEMKKFLLTSVLALPFLAFAHQDASAWHQFKFGVGMNLEGSSGGNSFGWGLWKSQQPPAPGGYGPVGHG